MKALSKEWLIEPKMWLDIFSNMDIGIGIYEEVNEGKDFVVKYFNEAAEEIVALKPEEYMDKSIKEIFPEIENTNFFQAIKEVYTTGVGYKLPASYYEDHRISLWKSNYISKLPSGHIASIFYDITASTELGTQLKKAEMDLKNELERYKNLFENAQEIVYIRDLEGKIISINKACERILGYKVEELIGANIRSIVHKDEYKYLEGEHILKSLDKDSKYSSEIRFITLEGSEKILEVTRCLYKKGSVYELQAIARDITERKEEERKVKYISFHDRLTGLNNRNYFEEKLNKLVEDKVYPLSVIMGDVNSLKLVNDAFGHEEGDRLLVEIGRILKKSSLEHSLVARIAGDEFIIITPFIKDSETLAIIKSIKEECENSSLSPIKPSIALGYAIMESLEENIHDIIKEAEGRMYRNKLTESKSLRSSIIVSLQKTLYETTPETSEHCERMKEIALEFGRYINLSNTDLDKLLLASLLHDIGKISIPKEILRRAGPLSEEEWDLVKRHCQIGYNIVTSSPELAVIGDYILYHHERWDGTGYPRGLKGEEIPLLSRLLCIVDAFDVMINKSYYKPSISKEEALLELNRCKGTQFDPFLVDKFLEMMGHSVKQ